MNGYTGPNGGGSVSGKEVWKFDGTQFEVLDVRAGTGSSNPTDLNFGDDGSLYFIADDSGLHGREVWRHAPGSAGAEAREIVFGPASGDPVDIAVVGNTVYANAFASIDGSELWRLNPDGTSSVAADIAPGPASGNPENLFAFADGVMFKSGDDLMRFDGDDLAVISAGIGDGIVRPQPLFTLGGDLYVRQGTSGNGEIFRYGPRNLGYIFESLTIQTAAGTLDGTHADVTLRQRPELRATTGFSAANAGDLNADGNDDVVMVDLANGAVPADNIQAVWLTGSGDVVVGVDTTINAVSSPLGTNPIPLGDVDQDGRDDFAIVGPNSINVYFAQLGTLDFANPDQQINVTSGRVFGDSATTGDFDGNGKLDLAVQTTDAGGSDDRVSLFFDLADAAASLTLDDADLQIEGESATDQFGTLPSGPVDSIATRSTTCSWVPPMRPASLMARRWPRGDASMRCTDRAAGNVGGSL